MGDARVVVTIVDCQQNFKTAKAAQNETPLFIRKTSMRGGPKHWAELKVGDRVEITMKVAAGRSIVADAVRVDDAQSPPSSPPPLPSPPASPPAHDEDAADASVDASAWFFAFQESGSFESTQLLLSADALKCVSAPERNRQQHIGPFALPSAAELRQRLSASVPETARQRTAWTASARSPMGTCGRSSRGLCHHVALASAQ